MAGKAEMALILSLVDQVTKTASKVKGDLEDVGKASQGSQLSLTSLGTGLLKLGAVGVAAGIAGVVAGVTAIGGAAFAAGMQYDDAMDTIAVSTGATGAELDALGDDFEAVFTSIPVDAETAAGVIGELNKTLGVTGDQLVDLAAPLSEASRMLGGDATANAKRFGQAMNAWKVDAEDAPLVLDMLFVATQKSGVGFDALTDAVTKYGPQLRALGFSLTDSVALLTAMEKSGIDSATAMMGLQFAAKSFVAAGVPLDKGLSDVITKIQGAGSETEALAIGMEVFGSRGALPMVDAIRAGTFSIDDLTTALNGAEGAIMATADATADFPEKLQVLKNTAATALAPLGVAMMDTLTLLVERFTPAFMVLVGFLTDNFMPIIQQVADAIGLVLAGDLQGAIASMFGEDVAAKVMTFLDGVRQVWAFIQENLEPILAGLGAIIAAVVIPAFVSWAAAAIPAAVATIAAAAPIILLVAAIGAAVALLVKAWKEDWGGIQEKTAAVVDWIKGAVEAFLTVIRAWWDEHGAAIIATVTGLWETVKNAFVTAFEWVKGLVEKALAAIRAWWDEHGDQVIATIVGLWETVKGAFDTAVTWISDLIQRVVAAWQAWWAEYGGNVEAIFRAAWDSVKTIFETVIGVIQNVFKAFKAAFQGDWRGFGEYLRAAWDILWAGIRRVLENAWTIITNYVQVVVGTLTGIWDKLKGTLERVWSQLWENIRTALSKAWDGLVAFIREMPGKIMRFFTETDWGQVGKDIISGIVNGLSAAGNAIKDKLMDFARGAWDAIKGFFGINSPSTLMMGAGRNIMQGMEQGILAAGADTLGSIQGLIGQIGGAAMQPALPSASLVAPARTGVPSGGYVQGYSREAVQQLFEMNAASITMPLAAAIAQRLRGDDEAEMSGTLRALGA